MRKLLLLCWVSLLGCHPVPRSSTQSVDLIATAPKDQKNSLLCWAYATTSLMETIYAEKYNNSGRVSEKPALRLSESFLAYSFYAQFIFHELSKPEFWLEPNSSLFFLPFEPNDIQSENAGFTAMDVLKSTGMVPFEVFPFVEPEDHSLVLKTLRKKVKEFIKDDANRFTEANDPDAYFDRIMEKIIFPSLFSDSPAITWSQVKQFSYKGQITTPLVFMRETLGFDPDQFEEWTVENLDDLQRGIYAVKVSLAQSIPVPILLPIYSEHKDPHGIHRGNLDQTFQFEGRNNGDHYMLVSDFVNKGGSLGSIPDLPSEVEKDWRQLEFLAVKNSYGSKQAMAIAGSKPGYDAFDLDYLEMAVADRRKSGLISTRLTFVLSKEILALARRKAFPQALENPGWQGLEAR